VVAVSETIQLPYRVTHPLYKLLRRYNHPELMNPYIIDYTYQYVKDSKIIYDPFAGVGTTALILRHLPDKYIILADIEETLVKAMKEVTSELKLNGNIEILHQDSTIMYMNVDAVYTSPPFLTINRGGGIYEKGYWRNGKPVDTELPFRHIRQYSSNPRNLSNMKDTYYWIAWQKLVNRVNARKWIIHGKDIVRKGRIIETWREYIKPLLAKGFKLEKLIVFKKHKREVSFWQNLMRKRGLPVVDYEWVAILIRQN